MVFFSLCGFAALSGAAEPHPLRWQALVVRALDGDTVELASGEIVRLLGVDTPETVDPRRPVQAGGPEAAAFTRGALVGRRVELALDAGPGRAPARDRYGRTLALIYLPAEESAAPPRLFNLELVRQGYAFAEARYPFTKAALFCLAERDARVARAGSFAARAGALDPLAPSPRGCAPSSSPAARP